jgi:hypothetical protein
LNGYSTTNATDLATAFDYNYAIAKNFISIDSKVMGKGIANTITGAIYSTAAISTTNVLYGNNVSGENLNITGAVTLTGIGASTSGNFVISGSTSGDIRIDTTATTKGILKLKINSSTPNGLMIYDTSFSGVTVGTASILFCTNDGTLRMKNTTAGNTSAGRYWDLVAESGGNFHIYDQGTGGMYLANGGTSWVARTSDERLKNKIEDISNGLEAISKLNPLTFKYKSEEQSGTPRYGFFAQNVGEAIPDAQLAISDIDPDLGNIYTYDMSIINVYAVQAIKELLEKVNSLEARINELENK